MMTLEGEMSLGGPHVWGTEKSSCFS